MVPGSLLPEKLHWTLEVVSLWFVRIHGHRRGIWQLQSPWQKPGCGHRNTWPWSWKIRSSEKISLTKCQCQQLHLPFPLSPPADKEFSFLIVLFCFQPPYSIIMTTGQWWVSFHFLHRQQQEITYKTGSSLKAKYTEMNPLRMPKGSWQ